MPSAVAVPIRQRMIELRQQGKSYRAIAEALGQSRHSVRQICRRWSQGGNSALTPDYQHCGHGGIRSERLIWRAAI
ncbi:helix-turn-helix domain-containing protein [Pseudanabaena sp. PCC 6802]|uniref:helix-turn-helix domain-containing protein n=1 Tax=Pseudanabaena sp. PCC 6802 TaxID=118173 RepID=UPI0003661725|nr:helix-turn-helix domain-containing protein [Pseudanabaena sp. PCC 6802]